MKKGIKISGSKGQAKKTKEPEAFSISTHTLYLKRSPTHANFFKLKIIGCDGRQGLAISPFKTTQRQFIKCHF